MGDQSRSHDAFGLDLRNRLRSRESVKTSPLSVVLFLSPPFSARSVSFSTNRARKKPTARCQLHYQRASSRRRSLLCRGDGAFRDRVQTRRRINGALSDVRQHVHFRGNHCWCAYGIPIRAALRRFRSCSLPACTCSDVDGRLPSWRSTSARVARLENFRAYRAWLTRRGHYAKCDFHRGDALRNLRRHDVRGNWRVSHPWIFWLSGAVFVQLRLLANLYDGMVAVPRGSRHPLVSCLMRFPIA